MILENVFPTRCKLIVIASLDAPNSIKKLSGNNNNNNNNNNNDNNNNIITIIIIMIDDDDHDDHDDHDDYDDDGKILPKSYLQKPYQAYATYVSMQTTVFSKYIMNHSNIGGLPLRSYLNAGMVVTRK